jgi:hypothetical protein
MICPHCQKTIREEERYLMSRDPDSELTPAMRRFGTIGVILIAALALAFLLHLAKLYGLPMG